MTVPLRRSDPPAGKFVPQGPYIGVIDEPNAGGTGMPSVDVPRLGITGLLATHVLIDFDPSTESASAGTAHTHGLGGPTFNKGDRVLVSFLEGVTEWLVVHGRCS